MVSILLSSNDLRANHLFGRLKNYCDIIGHVDFDDIDPLTRCGAAALTFRRSRIAWWRAYQMHSLMQRRRRRVVQRALLSQPIPVDALLMWGSWFHPTKGSGLTTPFFQYIDESLEAPSADANRVQRESFRLQAEAYSECSAIFCMSRWARDQAIASHPGCAERLHVVGWGPCGVDLSNEEIPEDVRQPIVLHVSNDFTRKGVDFLIQTAELVRSRLPAARFVVVGRDNSFDTRAVSETVSFVGRISNRDELSRYFRAASVFLLPHRFDRSPHVLVEAMSAGLPLVASAQGGAIELIENVGTGFLVPVGDVEGYADAIERLLVDRAKRAQMGAAARQLMRRSYTWDRVARNMVELMSCRLATSLTN